MRTNTIITLIIALVFGSLAVLVANMWLNSQTRTVATSPVASVVETSTIVVAASDLSYGSILTPEVLREIPWSKSSLPDGSFAKISELTSDGRRVVLSSISPNEPVLKWKISGPDERASLSALVTQGMRAVAIRINDVVGVGGFVLPGDRVDILYTKSGNEGSSTDVLIQNVRILAINQSADQKKSDPVVATVATVEVDTVDAQKIALAQTTGSLSLSLRSAGSLDQAKPQRVVEQELVSSPSVYESKLNAQAAVQAALDAKLKDLEARLALSDSSKTELQNKLAALQEVVHQTAIATAEDDQPLRGNLEALEKAIREASGVTGQDETALRAKLDEFEASFRMLTNTPKEIAAEASVSEVAAEVPSTMATVGVTRGTKRDSYQVPIDSLLLQAR